MLLGMRAVFLLGGNMFSEEEILYFKNLGILKRSMELVKMLFQNKLDKGNHTYLEHLEHVSQDFFSERKKAMALMHDVLEDTSITSKDLKNLGYDDKFIEVLEILTNTHDTYDEYIEYILKVNNKDAFEIKMKDLLHNMDLTRLSKITTRDLKRTEKYWKAYLKIIQKLEGEKL